MVNEINNNKSESMMSLLSYLVESSAWYEDTTESGFCYSSTTGHNYTVSFK